MMNDAHTRPELESALTKFFPIPDDAFLASLEIDLRSRLSRISWPTESLSTALPLPHRISAGLRAHRRASLTIGILLVILLSVVAIGPNRLASAWRRLSDYFLIGVGFVDVDQALALSAPVEDTRDGVTIRVEQVLAQSERTLIVLEIEGMSYEDQSLYFDNSYLLYSDGQSLRFALTSRIGYDHVHTILYFPQIPSNVRQLSLVWTDKFNLRLEWDGSDYKWEERFEAWSIPLSLVPAHEVEQTAFPFSYQPNGASDTQHGITFEVVTVSQDEDLVAVDLHWRWPLGDRRCMAFPDWASLQDEVGRSYPVSPNNLVLEGVFPYQEVEIQSTQPQSFGESRITDLFEATSNEAKAYRLYLHSVKIYYQLYEYFQVDLGDDPRVGNEWAPDIVFDLNGVPLRLTRARLSEAPAIGPMAVLLDLTWELPSELEHIKIDHVRAIQLLGPDSDDILWDSKPAGNPRTLTNHLLIATEDYPLRTGILKLYISDVGIQIQGPWVISWDVPERPAPLD